MNDIVEKLQALFGSDCILSQADASHRPASVWMAGEALYCKALARPKSTEELAEIMKMVAQSSKTEEASLPSNKGKFTGKRNYGERNR